jgi:PAS domain-containing protein
VVARAVEFRKALLDNLRMGEVQRRRGDMLEAEVTGRIRQVKRAQQHLVDLVSSLPVGIVVFDGARRIDLINPLAEQLLEPVVTAGTEALNDLLDRIPMQDGRRHGEAEVRGRRLELHLTELASQDEESQQVLVVLEPAGSGPAMGTIVQEMLVNLRGGLVWLGRREKDEAGRKILRGMASELASLATFLDIRLPEESAPDLGASAPQPARATVDETGLAPAVIPPPATPAGPPGNGREATPALPPRAGRPPTEPLPERTGSQMLRKGMTMVLEGRLRKKRYSEPASRPEDPERMQQKIDRWARGASHEDEVQEAEQEPSNTPASWPPPLPSSNP